MDDPIGKGSFGQVYRGKYLPTGQLTAAKQVYIGDRGKEFADMIKAEVALMKAIPFHNNILAFLDSEQDVKFIWIFTGLCELGDLDQYHRAHKVEMNDKFRIIVQVMTHSIKMMQYNECTCTCTCMYFSMLHKLKVTAIIFTRVHSCVLLRPHIPPVLVVGIHRG